MHGRKRKSLETSFAAPIQRGPNAERDDAMRLDDPIRWTRWLATGQRRESGTLRTLLLQVLQSQPARILPPRPLFNELLRRKRVGGGMTGGACWKADVELSAEVYEAFRLELSAEHRLETSHARTMDEWTADVFEHINGVDRAEHLAELQRLSDAEARIQDPSSFELLEARQRYMAYISAALAKARG